jgi:23S rRNA G2445 N2-methylase RlmL
MAPRKTIAAVAAASKACFTNVPRIHVSCSYMYHDFLKKLLQEKHNRKVFPLSGKEVVDQCFRSQATQQFKLDNDKLKRAMAEVNIDLNSVRPR